MSEKVTASGSGAVIEQVARWLFDEYGGDYPASWDNAPRKRDFYLKKAGELAGACGLLTAAHRDQAVRDIDEWLDSACSPDYQAQPLAQDWARVAKSVEEAGEAIAELILATGQNPRKPRDPLAAGRLLDELADVAWTGVLAIQHFTKDTGMTRNILHRRLDGIHARVPR